jgi:hypothetical protein
VAIIASESSASVFATSDRFNLQKEMITRLGMRLSEKAEA